MGLDFLDLIFRVEKEFKVRITQVDLEKMVQAGGVKPDVRISDLLELLVTRPTCPSCDYSLRGHVAAGVCPECGSDFDLDPEHTWERLQRILAAVARVDPVRITRESLLVRDLGFT